MGETTTLKIELSTATAERLDQLARSTNRSTTALAEQALERFLDVEAWQAAAIDEAIAEADAGGPFLAHEDMVRWLESWGSDNELPPPEPTVQR
jgi:predicted transcriptional regulator